MILYGSFNGEPTKVAVDAGGRLLSVGGEGAGLSQAEAQAAFQEALVEYGAAIASGQLSQAQVQTAFEAAIAARLPFTVRSPGTNRTLHTVTLVAANTEYSIAAASPAITLADCKRVIIDNFQGASDVRYAFTAGLVATSVNPHRTAPAGAERIIDLPMPQGGLFFASSTAGLIIKLEVEV